MEAEIMIGPFDMANVIYIESSFLCAVLLLFTARRVRLDIRNEEGACLFHVYLYSFMFMIWDIIWLTAQKVTVIPVWVLYAAVVLYNLFLDCLSFYWLRYVDLRCDANLVKTMRYKLIALIPLQIVTLVLISSIFTGWVFIIGDNREVILGRFWYIQYIVSFFYLICSCVDAFICARRAEDKRKKAVLAGLSTFIIAPALCGILMIFLRHTPVLSFGITVSAVTIYLNVQSREHAAVEKMKADKLRQDAVFMALNDNYHNVSIVDLDTERTLLFRVTEILDRMLPSKGNSLDFRGHVEQFAELLVHPEDRKQYVEKMSKDVIRKELETSDAYYVKYRVVFDGEVRYYRTKICRCRTPEGEEAAGGMGPNTVIIGIRSVDKEARREQEYQHNLESAVARRTVQLLRKNEELRSMSDEVIELLGNVVEARDAESGMHVSRVKGFVRIAAEHIQREYPEYGLTDDDVNLISAASALHDVGKILIPDSILLKPGRLTPEEFEVMKTHCEKGCEILSKAPMSWGEAYLKYSLQICRSHHEKYDGRGYPDGLAGEDIPIAAQIVSVADCFDALINERRYKPAFSPDEAYSMIMRGECGAFSPKILSVLTESLGAFKELAGAAG
jgi:HD-GYP domain-containing protein (c-di-GMP phosphodiesterase class II)